MHPFQEWISKNEALLPELTVSLFKDSLRCFFNDIERPAYLLAYQGVMVYVREILVISKAPTGYKEAEWQAKLKPTQNDDGWDQAVFDLIKEGANVGKGKDAPLNIPNSLRSQFEFWRIQRNVCAHYKQDVFLRAHVEAFYGFISHWLLKISGHGGKASMIYKLEDFCDPAKTPDDADITPLIDIIPQFVRNDEYDGFLHEGIKTFQKSPRKDSFDFISAILNRSTGHFKDVRNQMLSIIQQDGLLTRSLLEREPKYVIDLFQTPQEIRNFWYNDLPHFNTSMLNVFVTLLEANKIPDNEKQEAIRRIQENMKRWNKHIWDCDKHCITALQKHGYFDEFTSTYINSSELNNASNFRDWCQKSHFFIDHLSNAEMTTELINGLLDCFGSSKNYPYTLRDRLKKELWDQNSHDFKTRFLKVAKENGISIPNDWMQ